jgi:hypothetical protein
VSLAAAEAAAEAAAKAAAATDPATDAATMTTLRRQRDGRRGLRRQRDSAKRDVTRLHKQMEAAGEGAVASPLPGAVAASARAPDAADVTGSVTAVFEADALNTRSVVMLLGDLFALGAISEKVINCVMEGLLYDGDGLRNCDTYTPTEHELQLFVDLLRKVLPHFTRKTDLPRYIATVRGLVGTDAVAWVRDAVAWAAPADATGSLPRRSVEPEAEFADRHHDVVAGLHHDLDDRDRIIIDLRVAAIGASATVTAAYCAIDRHFDEAYAAADGLHVKVLGLESDVRVLRAQLAQANAPARYFAAMLAQSPHASPARRAPGGADENADGAGKPRAPAEGSPRRQPLHHARLSNHGSPIRGE